MLNVLIRAPLLSHSGYGVHARQIFRWALNRNFNIKCHLLPWGMTSWYLGRARLGGLVGEIMKRSGPPKEIPDISFQVQLPDEWDPSVAKLNVGITAVVETDKCNPQWVEAVNRMDAVIVPTKFCKDTLENTGHCRTKIFVIPESFPDPLIIDKPSSKTKFLSTKTKKNFLLFGQITHPDPIDDRKNTMNAISWFCEAFSNRKDVGLIVKTNLGTNSTLDRRVSKNKLSSIVNKIRPGKYPRIYLLHGDLNENNLRSLYLDKSLLGLISATRGEGFGLPLLEAAACGLPVMATNWSGHLDFLNHGKWTKVDYKLEEISASRADGRIFMQGTKWASPDEAHFKKCLKSFLQNRSEKKKSAEKLRATIQEKYNHAAIETYYDSFLEQLC